MKTRSLGVKEFAVHISTRNLPDDGIPAIAVNGASKTFGSVRAVKNVSFDVHRGEIFGLVGPNGAGKTTLIRMIMDIFRPDSGTIRIFGREITPGDKNHIGYLPEERGIYTKQKVQIVLEYFAQLKGLSNSQASEGAALWLERFDLLPFKRRPVEELSKGNQQKVQLIAALIADPKIIILDEPLAGLDPVNARLLTSLIRELAATGKTILFSSHQMNAVENLCNRILMIHKGEAVLYGPLDEIRQKYSDNLVFVRTNANFDDCPLIDCHHPCQNGQKVLLRNGVKSEELLTWLIRNGNGVTNFEQSATRLEDIYVQIVKEKNDATAK
jgi:ABC-2 type transport system ATP-binding protein